MGFEPGTHVSPASRKRVAGWAGLKPVLGGLGCGLLARVAGWAGPEAGSRQVRQAGLAWLGWAAG